MRVDSCRKCGSDLQKYGKCDTCTVCKEIIMQSFCPHCQIVTDQQHHRHDSKSLYAAIVCSLLNFSYVAQETSLALV
ncbi:MAG TPA: hypothetical protein VLF17_06645 [Candidatus Nitrosotenuis sp.]|nr:hypothetical protein [Candidatus Nitrosotenuis sp.]